METLETLRQRATAARQSFARVPPTSRRAPHASASSQSQSSSSSSSSSSPPPSALLQLASVVHTVARVSDALVSTGVSAWRVAQPYQPQVWLPLIYALFLLLFGGEFVTVVASIEATRRFGWHRIRLAFTALYYELQSARRALNNDNQLDDNADGVEDVKQLAASELAVRRLAVLSASVNPDNVSAALEGLAMAMVAITATLRVRFAAAITLGSAIGDVLCAMLSPFSSALLRLWLAEPQEKWISVVNRYAFRYAGMCLSWALARAVSSVLCATRGSAMLVSAAVQYGVRRGMMDAATASAARYATVGAWALLAALGLYAQLLGSVGSRFPFNVLLAPVWVAELALVLVVGRAR
ncbi:unnamed protein product [Agarophyton chilense]